MADKKVIEIQKQIKDLELELKSIQKEFTQIKTRMREKISIARKHMDEIRIAEIRKEFEAKK